MRLNKEVVLLLFIGIMIRLPVLISPISEGYRNAQTATLTVNMIENGELRFDPIAPWRGDLDARLVQELPVYNLLVLAVDRVPGIPLDSAGRLVSLLLWIVSFILLQFLWRWTLPSGARVWANLLFVLAPLNWYAGAAFMPETLVQLFSIAFMLLCLIYTKDQRFRICALLILVAGLGLLVKFPAFVHLGFFAALVWLDRLGWCSLFRPALLAGALLLVGCLVAWGRYADSFNSLHFDYWTGLRNLEGFIQFHQSRLAPSYYLPLLGVNSLFLLGLVGVPLAMLGFWRTLRHCRSSFTSRVWIYLFISLLAYWLIWAKAAPGQNYYNLYNLIFFAAMFGVGFNSAIGWMHRQAVLVTLRGSLIAGTVVALAATCVLGWSLLYKPDHVVIRAAEWIRNNTQTDEMVILQPRHISVAMDYEHQPMLSHLSGRRSWIWTRSTPEAEKQRALDTATHAIVTSPADHGNLYHRIRAAIKGEPPAPPKGLDETHAQMFETVAEGDGYTILRKL